ncbi:MAG: PQQ-binding-like beta-propeller repeat protein [Verrucomicrobiia bacterium]
MAATGHPFVKANRIGGLSTAAAIWLLCFSLQTASAQTRVALVSTCGGEAGQNVLALADVALSAETNVVLVERREVERVLQEQNLMHCGLSEAGQAVAAGQLLGVQVFASLETIPDQKEALGLVVFDAATGVVLWDSVLSGTNAEVAAVEVDAAVEAGCEKRQRPAGSLTRVCILSVRNVDLPRQFDSSCQSVGSILQRQLVQSPSLAVLERQHLENVNKERLLPAGVQTNQLLPSLVLIELDISRNGATNGLRGMAALSDSAGAKLGQVTASVESQNPADLSDRLLIELEKLLKATPSRIVVDRAREAERFYREANFLVGSREWADGQRAIEAANALMPTNAEFQALLVECLAREAQGRISGGRADLGYSLDVALRALEISRAFHEQAIARTGTTTQWHGPENWLTSYFHWALRAANNQDADTMRKLLEFQRRGRELLLDVLERQARAEVKDERSFEDYTKLLRLRLYNVEKFAPSSSVWTADTVDCVRSWLKMTEKFPLDWDSAYLISTRILARLCVQANGLKGLWAKMQKEPSGWGWPPHINNWQLQSDDDARIDELFHEMEHHPDPVVAAYGLAGHLSSRLRDASSADEIDQEYRRAKDFIRTQIAAPRRGPAMQYRALLYNAALDLIDLLPDPETRQREYEDLFDFMLGRKEIEYWVTRRVVGPRSRYQRYTTIVDYGGTYDSFPPTPSPGEPYDNAKLIANAHRVLALLHSGECHDIDTAQWSSNTGSFERELIWFQRDIKKEPASGPPVPWEGAKLLFPASGQLSNSTILSVKFDSNAFYVVLSGPRPRALHIPPSEAAQDIWEAMYKRGLNRLPVVRVPLNGGQPTFLGEALYARPFNYGNPFTTIPAIGDQKVFVGTDKGIFAFPLDGGTAQHITTVEGLPTDTVSSLAWLDGKLYAGLAGGYLVAYNLQTGECQVLASSRRRDARSSLDNVSPPTAINFMMPDPERHRILFTVGTSMFSPCAPQFGLWQIDVATEQLTQLVQLYSPPIWANSVGDGTVLMRFSTNKDIDTCGGSGCGVVSYELATGRTRLLSDCDRKQRPAGPQIPVPEGVLRMPDATEAPYIMADGWLWFAQTRVGTLVVDVGRVSTNAADLEYFPTSKETQGLSPFAWKSFHLLRDRGQMAIAGPNGIWLLNLKKHEASEDAPKDSP